MKVTRLINQNTLHTILYTALALSMIILFYYIKEVVKEKNGERKSYSVVTS